MGLLGQSVCPLCPSQEERRHLPSPPSPTMGVIVLRGGELTGVGVWMLVKWHRFYTLDHVQFLPALLFISVACFSFVA